MSEGDALLAAILAEPDDDTARLVYADWLEENGRAARAAFIRAQVEAARAEPFGPRARAAEERAAELLNSLGNWQEWTDAIRDHFQVLDFRFERGFVGHVELQPGGFLRVAEAVFAEHPVRSLRLVPHSNPDAHPLAPVFDYPCLRRLRRLEFAPRTEFLFDDYEALAGSRHLAGLTDLALAGCPINDLRWLEGVIAGESFPALAGLDLADITHAGPTVAAALGRAAGRAFRRLDLSRVALSSEEMLRILHARCLRQVEELRLGWSPRLPDDTGPLVHLNIGWVLPWERLQLLDLGGQRLGDEGVKEIVAKPEAAPLRWLGLADNALTPEAVRMLAGARHLSLNYLDVRRNWLGTSQIAELKARFPDAVVLG